MAKKNGSKRLKEAAPVLGAIGALSLAGGASAATTGAVADLPSQNISPTHEIALGEEEISDVSLATFYVFDKENAATSKVQGVQTAWWRCRCGWGCRRCWGCRCGCRC